MPLRPYIHHIHTHIQIQAKKLSGNVAVAVIAIIVKLLYLGKCIPTSGQNLEVVRKDNFSKGELKGTCACSSMAVTFVVFIVFFKSKF